MVRDVGVAEDLAQDALVAALEQWPQSGSPGQSGRLADGGGQASRHRSLPPQQAARAQASTSSASELEAREMAAPDFVSSLDDDVGDDLLRLIFTACHPVSPPRRASRSPCAYSAGLTTAEIARAFLVPEATIAQRIVRAKRTLSKRMFLSKFLAGPNSPRVFRRCWKLFTSSSTKAIPPRLARIGCARLCARMRSAWAASWRSVVPRSPKSMAWSRLWKFRRRAPGRASARRASLSCCWIKIARCGISSSSVAALPRSNGRENAGAAPGPYALQAAIAACHAQSAHAGRDQTGSASPRSTMPGATHAIPDRGTESRGRRRHGVRSGSRARAGRRAGLRTFSGELSPVAQRAGRFPVKLGRFAEARAEFEPAAALTRNAREQKLLRERAQLCAVLSAS